MLSDPLSLNTGATASAVAPAGATVQTYARTADGKYIGSSIGTIDQPHFLDITNRMNFNGSSVITVKSRQYFNVPAINGVVQKDDELSLSLQLVLPHRSALLSNVFDHAYRVYNAMVGYAPALLRGER